MGRENGFSLSHAKNLSNFMGSLRRVNFMLLILGFLLYFFLLLAVLALWHWVIVRWSLRGFPMYFAGFIAGAVAYFGMYGLTSVDVFRAMRELWYICFVDAYLAILAYDRIQAKFF